MKPKTAATLAVMAGVLFGSPAYAEETDRDVDPETGKKEKDFRSDVDSAKPIELKYRGFFLRVGASFNADTYFASSDVMGSVEPLFNPGYQINDHSEIGLIVKGMNLSNMDDIDIDDPNSIHGSIYYQIDIAWEKLLPH